MHRGKRRETDGAHVASAWLSSSATNLTVVNKVSPWNWLYNRKEGLQMYHFLLAMMAS